MFIGFEMNSGATPEREKNGEGKGFDHARLARIEPPRERDDERREQEDRRVVVEERRRDDAATGEDERERARRRRCGARTASKAVKPASRSKAPTSSTTPVM